MSEKDKTIKFKFRSGMQHVNMFKVIRSNKPEIEMWHIINMYSEKHPKRSLIAKLMLSLIRNQCQGDIRILTSSSFCTCTLQIWPNTAQND